MKQGSVWKCDMPQYVGIACPSDGMMAGCGGSSTCLSVVREHTTTNDE